jgi:hypothetical protein
VDHQEAGFPMRARGQGLLTILLVGLVAVLATAFDRLGVHVPAGASAVAVPTGAWLCPHGGGTGWEASLYLANPGQRDVTARVTSIAPEGPAKPSTVVVPASGEVRLAANAGDRAASTYVEFFGGWVAAGWVTTGAEDEIGVGAEPCSAAGTSWVSAGVSTRQDEEGYLVVMNPFAVDAVFDVAIFASPDRPPIRDSRLTDVTLDSGTSTAIKLDAFAEGEAAMAVDLSTSTGRVGASTMVVSGADGIASVIASPTSVRRLYLPTSRGAGDSELTLAVPTGQGSEVGVLMLTRDPPQPIGGGLSQALEPTSASSLSVATTSAASVDVSVQEGDPLIAALRTKGKGHDSAATGGAASARPAWVVTPTVAGEPAKPGLLLLNPGNAAVSVTLRLLPREGEATREISVEVPPATLVAVPASFLETSVDASVLVTTQGGGVIPLGASTSLGLQAIASFGSAVGVPIPAGNA